MSEDLTVEDRKLRKKLYEHYRAAKAKGYSAKLLETGVIINGTKYTCEQLGDCSQPEYVKDSLTAEERKQRRSVSLPTSPSSVGLQEYAAEDPELSGLLQQGTGSQRCQDTDETTETSKVTSIEPLKTADWRIPGPIPKQKKPVETRTRSGSKSSSKQ